MNYKKDKNLGKPFKAQIVLNFLEKNPLNYNGASINIWKYKQKPKPNDNLRSNISHELLPEGKVYYVNLYNENEILVGRFSFDEKIWALSLKDDFECDFKIEEEDDDNNNEIWHTVNEEIKSGVFNDNNYLNGKRITEEEKKLNSEIENKNPFLVKLKMAAK